MRRRRTIQVTAFACCAAAALLASAGRVDADAAPEPMLPGSAPEVRGHDTKVQLVSEEVVLEIAEINDRPTETDRAGDVMRGRVDAEFVMRNQGRAEESFDVWFPLGWPDLSGTVSRAADFAAYVDGVPATVSESRISDGRRAFHWATWPVAFAPGRNVVLRATYSVDPTDYYPYGVFSYALETGAGWYGNIPRGTVRVRLPYDVTGENSVLHEEVWDALRASPRRFAVEGTDVVWRFSSLEPSSDDNVQLAVLAPHVWRRIVRARDGAVLDPDSPAAHWDLARALEDGVVYGGDMGLESGLGNSGALASLAEESYKTAVSLMPDDVELLGDYASFLFLVCGAMCSTEHLGPEVSWAMEHGLSLEPGDERLLKLQDTLEANAGMATQYATAMATYETPLAASGRSTPVPPAVSALRDDRVRAHRSATPSEPASTPAIIAATSTEAPTGAGQAATLPNPWAPTGERAGGGLGTRVLVLVAAAFAVLLTVAWAARRFRARSVSQSD